MRLQEIWVTLRQGHSCRYKPIYIYIYIRVIQQSPSKLHKSRNSSKEEKECPLRAASQSNIVCKRCKSILWHGILFLSINLGVFIHVLKSNCHSSFKICGRRIYLRYRPSKVSPNSILPFYLHDYGISMRLMRKYSLL